MWNKAGEPGWNVKSGQEVEGGEAGEMHSGFGCSGKELRFLSGK